MEKQQKNTPSSTVAFNIGQIILRDHRKESDSSVRVEGRRDDLLYKAMYTAKLRGGDVQTRMADANVINARLLMTEIMMANIMQKYVCDVYDSINERGLMRHIVKKHANDLRSLCFSLQSVCNKYDVELVKTFCTPIYAPLVNKYIEDGGTMTANIQLSFSAQYENLLSKIYFSTKNLLDKSRISESKLCAQIEMVSMLAYTGLEFYNAMCHEVDKLLDGFCRVTRLKSLHNERILHASTELLRQILTAGEWNGSLPEKEYDAPRTFTKEFQRELSSERMMEIIENGVTALRSSFTHYVIATIRIKIHRQELRFTDIRTLTNRLGTVRNVRKLLQEISDIIPYPNHEEGETIDAIDLSETFPDFTKGSAIDRYIHLCIEDHILLPDKEDDRVVWCRLLRQEARSNSGILPKETVKKLYREFGTKKKVLELFKESGPELRKTYNLFVGIPVKELK